MLETARQQGGSMGRGIVETVETGEKLETARQQGGSIG